MWVVVLVRLEIIIKYSVIIQRRLHIIFAPGLTQSTQQRIIQMKKPGKYLWKLGISPQHRQDGEVWWEEFLEIFQFTGLCGDSGWSWRVKQPKPSQEFPVALIPIKLSHSHSPPALRQQTNFTRKEFIWKLKLEQYIDCKLVGAGAGWGSSKYKWIIIANTLLWW